MKALSVKISTVTLLAFVFSFSIFGFGVFSNFPELLRLPRTSVYIPRAIVLFSAALLIMIVIKYFRERRHLNLSIILFLSFWFFYSLRLFYDLNFSDVRMNRDAMIYLNFAQKCTFTPLFTFTISLTSSKKQSFMKYKKTEGWLMLGKM